MKLYSEDLQKQNNELLRLLTQHLPDMLWIKDTEGKYLYVNQSICDGLLMATDTQEPIGKDDVFFALREREKHKDDPNWHTFGELCFNSDRVVIDNNKSMKFEEYGNVKGKLLYLEVYKAPFHDDKGNIIGTVGAGRDITQLKQIQFDFQESLYKLKEQKKILRFQANYDYLTKLHNRVFFMTALQTSIDEATANNSKIAILFMDIDHFKEINDSLGHYIGDLLLVEFAKRLKVTIRPKDTLARFGGDEFCIILNNIDTKDEITDFIDEAMKIFTTPFDIESNLLYVSMSIGISMAPDDDIVPIKLLKNADSAMYEAKDNGRNTYSFYTKNMTLKATKKVLLERKLRDALRDDQFEPYLQPQVDARSQKIVGMEALIRWITADGLIIEPSYFLGFAEDTGMITLLDRIVIIKTIQEFIKWREQELYSGSIAFNLSTRQLEDKTFLDFANEHIKPIVEKYPNSIEFEITETQIMINQHHAINILNELAKFGVKISIDDFGTGYSSLAYIKKLPIHKLKIDHSFIEGLPLDAEDVAISKTIITLAKILNLHVIAEGVETKEQVDFLLENGCNIIQGYYYSKPLKIKEMELFLHASKRIID